MIGEKTVREIAMVVAENCGCEKIMENKVEKFLCDDYDTIQRVYQTLAICLPLQYEISMNAKGRVIEDYGEYKITTYLYTIQIDLKDEMIWSRVFKYQCRTEEEVEE